MIKEESVLILVVVEDVLVQVEGNPSIVKLVKS